MTIIFFPSFKPTKPYPETCVRLLPLHLNFFLPQLQKNFFLFGKSIKMACLMHHLSGYENPNLSISMHMRSQRLIYASYDHPVCFCELHLFQRTSRTQIMGPSDAQKIFSGPFCTTKSFSKTLFLSSFQGKVVYLGINFKKSPSQHVCDRSDRSTRRMTFPFAFANYICFKEHLEHK